MALSLLNIMIKPDLITLLYGDRPPVYSLSLRIRNTKVPVWTHESKGYPKMDISHRDAAIHYCVQLAQYRDHTRSCNATLWISPHVYSLALRLMNNKVPVWTHKSIGYLKMDISHWEAAIHFCVQLAQYCDQTRSCNSIVQIFNMNRPDMQHIRRWEIASIDVYVLYSIMLNHDNRADAKHNKLTIYVTAIVKIGNMNNHPHL